MTTDYRRVRYEKNPLLEVVFQLRFPTILSINSEQPIDFQKMIRKDYPFLEEQLEEYGNVFVDTQLKSASMNKTGENKNYSFISQDRKTKVNLTPSFIAVSTLNYLQWEFFCDHVFSVLPVFEEIYQPPFYTRVGLRYTNAITRSRLGLDRKSWADLFEPHILGMISREKEREIKTYISEIEYESDESKVNSKAHFELVHLNNQPEMSFLLDCDYYSLGITALSQIRETAEKLHRASSKFLQSAIKDELHTAMGPREIE